MPQSRSQDDAASAVAKLEAWFSGLDDGEQELIAPILVEGIVATMEGVDEEVQGFGQIGAGPPLLQALDGQRAPTLTYLVGVTDWMGNTQPPSHLRRVAR